MIVPLNAAEWLTRRHGFFLISPWLLLSESNSSPRRRMAFAENGLKSISRVLPGEYVQPHDAPVSSPMNRHPDLPHPEAWAVGLPFTSELGCCSSWANGLLLLTDTQLTCQAGKLASLFICRGAQSTWMPNLGSALSPVHRWVGPVGACAGIQLSSLPYV